MLSFGRWVSICVVAALSVAVARAEDAPKKYKVLFLTQSKGFEHGSVRRKAPGVLAPAEVSLTQVGVSSGLFDVECTQDASIITPEKLKELDVLFFYTTGDFGQLPISEANFTAILEWLKSGKAFCGAHSATDTLKNFKPYYELINGSFAGHDWNSNNKVTLTNHDPAHPVTKMFEPEFEWTDEIYQYKNFDPKSVRVLQSLNMEKCNPKRPWYVAVCWVREYGQGRLFYTNLGHNEKTWESPKFKEHLLAGMRWAVKLEQGSATPNPEVAAAEEKKAVLAVFEELKPALKDIVSPGTPEETIAKFETLAKDDPEGAKKLLGDLRNKKSDLDGYNAAMRSFDGVKPWVKETVAAAGGNGDEAIAKLEKMSKDEKNNFKNLIGDIQKAKNEKDAVKKKSATENVLKRLGK